MKSSVKAKPVLIALVAVVFLAFVFAALFFDRTRAASHSASTGMPVKDFSLLDQDGNVHHLYDYSYLDGIVILSHGSYCNFSALSLPELQDLSDQYGYKIATSHEADAQYDSRLAHNEHETSMISDSGTESRTGTVSTMWNKVRSVFNLPGADENSDSEHRVLFLLLNANTQEDEALLLESLDQLGIDLPILKDHTQLVAKDLGFDRTGEVVLIDPKNWTVKFRGPVNDRIDFETQKKSVENHYLRAEIEALLDGEDVHAQVPQAVGCLIYYETDQDATESKNTYASRVAPILEKNCSICHKEGGIAPWSMDNYEMIRAWSPMIREVLMNKRMPPWHADPHFGNFKNDISLSDAETTALVNWIDAGTPRGDSTDPLTQVSHEEPSEWALGEPDLVIELPVQKIPAKGPIDYRYPEVDIAITEDKWVRAVEMKPSNAAVMHHAFSFITYPESMQKEEPKWLFGLRSYFGVYVPGGTTYAFPDDSGIFLPQGAGMKFQLHYDPKGYETTDNMRLALYFHDKPPQRQLEVVSIVQHDFTIPANAPDHEVTSFYTFENDVLLYGMFPHMHYRGSRFKFEKTDPDGRHETLLSVPDYKFNWQRTYLLDEPMRITAGTRITATGAFNNSISNKANPDASQVVRWGEQSFEEMFLGYLIFSEPRKP